VGRPRIPKTTPNLRTLRVVDNSYEWLRTWRYVIVRPPVKNVGFAIATFANKQGEQVFPGVRRLMSITGHSKSTVIEALATMRWMGFLFRKVSNQGSSSGLSDEYQLCLPIDLSHIPMIGKNGREPAFESLPPEAQQTARILDVAARLERSGSDTEPGVDREPNHPWFAEQTPPTHNTNTYDLSAPHVAGQRASSQAAEEPPEDLLELQGRIADAVGGLTLAEESEVRGMLVKHLNPIAIIRTIRKGRGSAA
jgi:DNA-binding transcriptional MocR family regulator